MRKRLFRHRCWWIMCGCMRTDSANRTAKLRFLFDSRFEPFTRPQVPFAVSGVANWGKLCYTRYIFWFGPDGVELGFHEEWLRDEPCDATTTGRCKTGSRCQLSPGNGGHEIRKMGWPSGFKHFRIQILSSSPKLLDRVRSICRIAFAPLLFS